MSSQQLIVPYESNNALKIASGVWTTVAAADTVTATGLRTILACVVSLVDDPADDPEWCSANFDPTAAPSALGTDATFTLKTWKNTGGTDPTPAAASTFSKKVSWIAVGY